MVKLTWLNSIDVIAARVVLIYGADASLADNSKLLVGLFSAASTGECNFNPRWRAGVTDPR
ncbi:hypothetical protein B5K06_29125 [Rhizobium grahamii]|uniref:Uncharacterized protein n=2 Tax=Rhizobium grahamii TaxID=1120045 RepID=S3HF89_9HYPH|nr:hypothetical protein RGCCGE502_18985 [Rhizobium grahamii CCGE 502]RDJ03967.1 hypothetical protein B5K06_29125 [Rhizobium grahamii]